MKTMNDTLRFLDEQLTRVSSEDFVIDGIFFAELRTLLDGYRTVEATHLKALDLIERFGGIDGAHHKTWVIDQVARVLVGDGYDEWVRDMKDGDDGPETYGWDEGIAP